MIRVAILDDRFVVRAGLRALCDAEDDLTLGLATGDAHEFVSTVAGGAEGETAAERFDVLVIDPAVGQASERSVGANVLTTLRELRNAVPVLVFTDADNDVDLLAALDAGAAGYVLKSDSREALLAALRDTADGGAAFSSRIAVRLVTRARPSAECPTEAEQRVLLLVGEGLTNRSAADRLSVSEATVKTHVAHLLSKLGVGSRSAAVAEARRRGWLR